MIYWILHKSFFLVKTHELSSKRLEIKLSHAKPYSLEWLVYSHFDLPDALSDTSVPSPVTWFCVRGSFLSMCCFERSRSTSCWIWSKRRVLRNRETCCQKRSLGQKDGIARLPELSLNRGVAWPRGSQQSPNTKKYSKIWVFNYLHYPILI